MKVQVENLKSEWASISGKLTPELAREYDSDLIEGLEYYSTDSICKKTIDLFVELCNEQLARQTSVGDDDRQRKLRLVKARARAAKAKLALLAI